MRDQQFGRPFNLTTADGTVYHGVEFPSGRVILDHQTDGLVAAWLSMELLLAAPDMGGVAIERPEETHDGV